MQLILEGKPCDFIPVKQFRAEHDLPPEFGVAVFEPKDFTGLGRIDAAGAALNHLRDAVLTAVDALQPPQPPAFWLAHLPALQAVFTAQMVAINERVGLREFEIDFAAAGFRDVCETVIFARLRAGAGGESPVFAQIYADWLANTTRVSTTIHRYLHQGQTWQIQIVTHAYGRAGMLIRMDEQTQYVADGALGCPAEGYMLNLLAEMAARLLAG